ncbi:hypothetical protein AMTR_s00034p00240210 [Amborella trichopoda]|uniref:Pectinesterase inhibitor domain-containing protein n=2 Tax=Amborella trichopoda TaxID=13333 RepID=W1PXU6_AMBTC|nr:hypothetical protein AMTR_s00034p00240210 [Amborella trichopoda]
MVELRSASGDDPNFIRASCHRTLYQALCFTSLSPYAATIQSSHRQMAHAALSVGVGKAQSSSAAMSNMMVGLSKDTSKRAAVGAVRDCMENMANSIDELQQAIAEDEHLPSNSRATDFGEKMSNIQTWVSAALTEDDTCMDGFRGIAMDVDLMAQMRISVLGVAHLTSNALALINALNETP